MDFLGQRLWEPWRFTNSLALCRGGFRIRQGQRPSSSRMGSQLLKWRTIESTKNIAGAGLEALLPLRNMIRSRGSPCFLKLPWLQHGSISEFDGSLIYSRQVKCWDFSSSDGELTFSKKKKKKVKSCRMTAVQLIISTERASSAGCPCFAASYVVPASSHSSLSAHTGL